VKRLSGTLNGVVPDPENQCRLVASWSHELRGALPDVNRQRRLGTKKFFICCAVGIALVTTAVPGTFQVLLGNECVLSALVEREIPRLANASLENLVSVTRVVGAVDLVVQLGAGWSNGAPNADKVRVVVSE
jgi:hypothetical protein